MKTIRFYGMPGTLADWRRLVSQTTGREGTAVLHDDRPSDLTGWYVDVKLTAADRDVLMHAWRDGWNTRVAFIER